MIDFEFPHARPMLAILTLGCLVMLWGCSNNPPAKSKEDPQAKKEEPKKPEEKKLDRVIEQPALIEAYEETPMVARVAGYVNKINVDIDSPIKGPKYDKDKLLSPGEVLAELWVPELEQELVQKKALVSQFDAEVKQADASLQAALAQVATAKAAQIRAKANFDRWDSEYKRVDDLVSKKVLDKQVLAETLNQKTSSEAAMAETKALVDESEAKKAKAGADVEVARARVAVAKADRERVEALWEYRLIRAPYNGVVTKRNVHTGHQPSIGPNATPLFVVARTDKFRVIADFPEAEAILVEKDMKARVRVPALKNRVFAGDNIKVSRTSWSLDRKNRTLRVEIDLPNTDQALRPGLFAFVTLGESAK